MVLAAASPFFRTILLAQSNPDDENASISLPHVKRDQVQCAVDAVYKRLSGESSEELSEELRDVIKCLGIDLESPTVIEPAEQVVVVKKEKKIEVVEKPVEKPKKRKKRKRREREYYNEEDEDYDPEKFESMMEANLAVKDDLDGFIDDDGGNEDWDEDDEEEEWDSDEDGDDEAKENRRKAKKAKLEDAKPRDPPTYALDTKSMDVNYVREQVEGRSPDNVIQISETLPPIAPRAGTKLQNSVLKSLTTTEGAFQILMGIKMIDGQVYGRPLAWTAPHESLYYGQLESTGDVFRYLYGISKVQLYSTRMLYSSQDHGVLAGKKEALTNVSTTSIYKEYSYQLTRHELEAEFLKPEMVDGLAESQPNAQEIDLPDVNDWNLILDPNLAVFDNVAVIGCERDGVTCRTLDQTSTADKDDLGNLCINVLCLVWSGGVQGSMYPANEQIFEKYKLMYKMRFRKYLAKKLLDSGEELPKKSPHFTCEICGKTFQENKGFTRRANHMKSHGMTLTNIRRAPTKTLVKAEVLDGVESLRFFDRRNPFKVVTQCTEEGCDFTGTQDKVDEHFRMHHKTGFCSHCGVERKNGVTLRDHIKKFHKPVNCQVCGLECIGIRGLSDHLKKIHKMELESQRKIRMRNKEKKQCQYCPKIFAGGPSLRNHYRQVHGGAEERPWQCRECPKNFFVKIKLAQHRLSCHIKTRPYVCRSPGCSANFNHIGNLAAHEKKLHGQKFTDPLPDIFDIVPDYVD